MIPLWLNPMLLYSSSLLYTFPTGPNFLTMGKGSGPLYFILDITCVKKYQSELENELI